MPAPKRATTYFDPGLHKALRLRAAETERSLAALRHSLAKDSDDLAAFEEHPRHQRRHPRRYTS